MEMGPLEKIVDQIRGVFKKMWVKNLDLGSGTPKRDITTEILGCSEKLIGNAGPGSWPPYNLVQHSAQPQRLQHRQVHSPQYEADDVVQYTYRRTRLTMSSRVLA